MKILQIHNSYKSGVGGEDIVVNGERGLLIEHGNEVEQYLVSNSDIDNSNLWRATVSGIKSIWSVEQYKRILKLINHVKPDLVHVHNTFAVLSPGIFWAIKQTQIPCVLTLHNYRIICASSTLFRNNIICESCIDRFSIPAIYNRCSYSGSSVNGLLIAITQIIHRLLKTYPKTVDRFIVLNPQFEQIIKRAGVSQNKICIKYNFTFDKYINHISYRKPQFVYVGQIELTKGIKFLLNAWISHNMHNYQLVIIGDGPEKAKLQESFKYRSDITWLGQINHEKVLDVMKESKFLIMPSLWYEPFGLASIEALMLATPIILPDHIGLTSIVKSDNVGFIYDGNSILSLRKALNNAFQIKQQEWDILSFNARRNYESNFTPENNYKVLASIYHTLI